MGYISDYPYRGRLYSEASVDFIIIIFPCSKHHIPAASKHFSLHTGFLLKTGSSLRLISYLNLVLYSIRMHIQLIIGVHCILLLTYLDFFYLTYFLYASLIADGFLHSRLHVSDIDAAEIDKICSLMFLMYFDVSKSPSFIRKQFVATKSAIL